MPEQPLNCPYGPDSDIDARYLAGTLSPEESEAFEEHYFGCDRCFAAVQRGNEIRAAMSAAADTGVVPLGSPRRRLSPWQPALVAAAVVVIAVGIRQASSRKTVPDTIGDPVPIDASRGTAPQLALRSHATSTALAAAWSPLTSAHSYRVRLLGADGSLLFERETTDTVVVLARDLVRNEPPVYWEVLALDALRGVVASSQVVQAETSPGPP